MMLCVQVDDRLIGVGAEAENFVKFRGEMIQARYIYDLRVYPYYRRFGTAKQLVHARGSPGG